MIEITTSTNTTPAICDVGAFVIKGYIAPKSDSQKVFAR